MSTSSFYTSSGTSQTLERSVADAADDAQKLATNPEDSQFTLSNGTTGFQLCTIRLKQKMKRLLHRLQRHKLRLPVTQRRTTEMMHRSWLSKQRTASLHSLMVSLLVTLRCTIVRKRKR